MGYKPEDVRPKRISEVVDKLLEIKEKHGDLDVWACVGWAGYEYNEERYGPVMYDLNVENQKKNMKINPGGKDCFVVVIEGSG